MTIRVITITLLTIILSSSLLHSQARRTDANIFGHVVADEEHLPFVSVFLKNTTIGTVTDETGHYSLVNLPEGEFTVVARFLGYKTKEIEVNLRAGETKEVNFNLEADILGTMEVVVTADRNARDRTDASVIVNTLTPHTFSLTQSVTMNEGLAFMPGIRVENNCSNCGFNQVRMNGMEGPYSQILINSRPIFSGLAGVYGMEMIPSNMIERVEVVRGSGSALYGSNAIAGTINIILKDPLNNSFEFNSSAGLTGLGVEGRGSLAGEQNIGFNSSVVTGDGKSGLSLYGFKRARDPFDTNDDGFSQLSRIGNTTLGARLFHRFNQKNRLSVDYFSINEERRGGDSFHLPYHEALLTEAVRHNINSAALTFEQFTTNANAWSLFLSLQDVKRDSYYGAGRSLSDYGYSEGLTWVAGSQYNYSNGAFSMVSGLEFRSENLTDEKLGYPDLDNATIVDGQIVEVPHTENILVADQKLTTGGLFSQADYRLGRAKLSAGLRVEMYDVFNNVTGEGDSDIVISPRLNMLYDITPRMQGRLSYSQGYRAPQVFDEDLHISTSGSRQVIIVNDPNLEKETSHSLMASVDFSRRIGDIYIQALGEAFYTMLRNPFANEFGDPDEDGVVTYVRTNEESGAVVQGINTEVTLVPSQSVNMTVGFTIQRSRFEEPVDFGERAFFRTPDKYGFFTFSWQPGSDFQAALTGTYTGTMLVPYFGEEAPDPTAGLLRDTERFLDMGFNIRYDARINGSRIQFFGGMKNIFNSYQSDFDKGVDRDPDYIYGPLAPRSVYVGLRTGIFR